MFAWLGDASYIDVPLDGAVLDMEWVKDRFKNTFQDGGYQDILGNGKTLITGVWDDHDYGENNVGAEFIYKDRNRELYLDFLEEDSASQRRT